MNKPLICPWCERGKFYPLKNPRGVMSVKCDKCHRPVNVDWDNKTTIKGSTIKYAS